MLDDIKSILQEMLGKITSLNERTGNLQEATTHLSEKIDAIAKKAPDHTGRKGNGFVVGLFVALFLVMLGFGVGASLPPEKLAWLPWRHQGQNGGIPKAPSQFTPSSGETSVQPRKTELDPASDTSLVPTAPAVEAVFRTPASETPVPIAPTFDGSPRRVAPTF